MKHALLALALLSATALALNSAVEAQSSRTSAASTGAAPESVNILLHDNDSQYIVPTGKVLLIEHFIWALENSTHQTVSIVPANDVTGVGDFQLKFTATAPDMFTPERPIRIVGDGNAGVRIFSTAQVDWRDVLIVGVLRDA